MNNLYIIIQFAKKEFLDKTTNFFIYLLTILFLFLNIFLLYFSDVFYLKVDEIDYRSVILSVIHLQMYVIPFFSLLLSFDSILKERELGVLNLFLSYPFNFSSVLYGKLLGYFSVIVVAFTLGFTPVIFFLKDSLLFKSELFFFILCCFWLCFIFILLGLFISMFFKDRTVVILYSVVCWLLFVFLYDFFFITLLIVSDGYIPSHILNYILLVNPVEIFKIISVLLLLPLSASEIFGIDITIFNNFLLFSVVFFWFLIPFSIIPKLCLILNKRNKYVR